MNKKKYLFFAFIGGMIILYATYMNARLNNQTQYMQSIFEINVELLENKEVKTSTKLAFKKSFDKMIIKQDINRSQLIYLLWGIGFFCLIYSAFVRTYSKSDY
jgi:hypothetical protein